MTAISREQALALDAADPLAALRSRFVINDPELIYVDGNSLGRLSRDTRERLVSLIDDEWGSGLIRGWEHWVELPTQVGDQIAATLLGAAAGQTVVGDSTSVNLYKLACAAIDARPGRTVVVTDDDNFPTDLYILQGICERAGLELRIHRTDIDAGITAESLTSSLGPEVALVCLSHVAYRSGVLADMAAITAAVHGCGALMLWDLSHSVGSVPIQLDAHDVDLATGCTYKYVNGGPGSPAFAYMNARLLGSMPQPIWGWFGQREQFAMGGDYDPVPTVGQLQIGTPQVLQIAGLESSVALLAEAGIGALREKGVALTELIIALADEWLTAFGVRVASPRTATTRGSHIVLEHPAAWQLCQALIARNVIPDYRNPNRVRIGPAPIYTRYVDVWDAMDRLRSILESGEWEQFDSEPSRVT